MNIAFSSISLNMKILKINIDLNTGYAKIELGLRTNLDVEGRPNLRNRVSLSNAVSRLILRIFGKLWYNGGKLRFGLGNFIACSCGCARMAELVYAFDLKSNGEIHMGSSPISGTMARERNANRMSADKAGYRA